jgi:RNA polymerase sigma-70 factor (ECF subfamily)
MNGRQETEVTGLLRALREPGADSQELEGRLFSSVYDELRAAAEKLMWRERAEHTLQPTALVHEAFLKLTGGSGIPAKDRAHFLSVATRAMRQVLVDHARRRLAGKRGHDPERVTLTTVAGARREVGYGLVELNELLERLEALSPRMAKVAELRIFGGTTHEEAAAALAVSVRTVADDWAFARRWLSRELSPRTQG